MAHRLRWTKATVGKWRQRFVRHRLAGLYDELRPGRPHTIEDEKVAALLKRARSRKPAAGTYWSVRLAARASGISKSTVHRLFQTFALQPHRSRTFKLSTDPFFVEKVHCPTLFTYFRDRKLACDVNISSVPKRFCSI